MIPRKAGVTMFATFIALPVSGGAPEKAVTLL